MTEVDELDINPLFKALQTKFESTYQKAQEDCHLICIPKAECLRGAYITQKFVNTHILKPSPFFKGQYMTILSDKQIVTVDSQGTFVSTDEGFPTRVKIKVLSEELCYNKEYKPYKILIIDRPLDFNVIRKQHTDEKNLSGEYKLKYSQKECKEVLQSYPEFAQHIKDLDSQIWKFNHTYMLLKDYLEDAISRLEAMFEATSEKCIHSMKGKTMVSHQCREYISATVETYLMASVHNKLYPVICEHCHGDDVAMVTKCSSLQGLTPDQLGVPECFCCPLPSAVAELVRLGSLVTPIEKFYCLKSTFDSITEGINHSIQESQPPGVSVEETRCLTSDDLIPILVTVIVQAGCRHIHSDIYFMENFYWSAGTKDTDNLSYCLVTFKAAVQYMMTTDFSDIQVQSKLEENQPIVQNHTRNQLNNGIRVPGTSSQPSSVSSRPRAEPKSRFNRQMENITKMLEETAVDMDKQEAKPPQPVFPSIFGGSTSKSPVPSLSAPKSAPNSEKQAENMGDFLSSLQDNMFLSFGKQT